MTRVAVAIPTRGRAAWCEEAARSALAQEGVDVEAVVALDGEDADTRARLLSIGDPRLRVVSQPAKGRSAARNLAWRSCRSDLVAFLDDDDVLLPHSLAARAAALERHPDAVLCHGGAVATAADGGARDGGMMALSERPQAQPAVRVEGPAGLSSERSGSAAPRERVENGLLMQWRGRSLLPSAVLARRDALERAGGFPEDLPTGEDWLLFLRAAALGPFVEVDAPVVLYRRHSGQVRWDPAQQEATLPTLLSRYFDDPATPPEAARWRGRLEARLLAFIARNHRRLGRREDAHRCLRAAVAKDPRLLLHPRRLRHWLGALLARSQ